MLFNSTEFVFVFFPVVFLVFWLLSAQRARYLWLTLSSYLFYGYWDVRFCALMLLSTLLDFYCGSRIAAATDRRTKKGFLILSLSGNLGLLGFFKYADFFLGSINIVAARAGLETGLPLLRIVLPVGISFYTFQSLSYTLDIYRGRVTPATGLGLFACYVSMFPQLVAGPIVRYREIGEQLASLPSKLEPALLASGIWFFTMGLAKKVLVADGVAGLSDPLLAQHDTLQLLSSWTAILGYTVQIYFDFSGYSDMAVGLGLMLGLRLPQNFNSPYQATSISDFWRRWHISLSSWLRDYLFVPLGGSRGGRTKTLRNLVITMFLGGLWHGADWLFVLWGLYHGLLLAVHAWLAERGFSPRSPVLKRALTFLAVVFGWAIFRSTDPAMLGNLVSAMTGLAGIESTSELRALSATHLPLALVALLAWVFLMPNTWQRQPQLDRRYGLLAAALFCLCVMKLGDRSPFLYFQF